MIAGEAHVNGVFSSRHVILYALDSLCWRTTKIGSDVLHIHAWHSDIPWSKRAFFRGEYRDWKVDFKEAFLNAANYCQWAANLSSHELQKIRAQISSRQVELDYGLFQGRDSFGSHGAPLKF